MNNPFGFSGRVNKPMRSLESGVFVHTREEDKVEG